MDEIERLNRTIGRTVELSDGIESNDGIEQWNRAMESSDEIESSDGIEQWHRTMERTVESGNGIYCGIRCGIKRLNRAIESSDGIERWNRATESTVETSGGIERRN